MFFSASYDLHYLCFFFVVLHFYTLQFSFIAARKWMNWDCGTNAIKDNRLCSLESVVRSGIPSSVAQRHNAWNAETMYEHVLGHSLAVSSVLSLSDRWWAHKILSLVRISDAAFWFERWWCVTLCNTSSRTIVRWRH